MAKDDAQEIRRLLEDRIESVLDSLASGWAKRGNTAYLTPKNKKDLGSFQVSLDDRNRLPRGCWKRFSQDIGGGSVELVSYLLTNGTKDYKTAFEWARRFLGLENARAESPEERTRREVHQANEAAARQRRQEQHAAEQAKKVAKRLESAQDVWEASGLLQGSHGEDYLVQGRGLPPISEWPWDCSDTLRFHPSLEYEREIDLGRFPALVAKVSDAFGDLTAVWQIYLDPVKPAKARVPDAKIGRGPAAGGAVRLGGDGDHVGTAEGMETALGAWFLEGCRYPVWACLSTSGIIGFEPPEFIKRHTGWMDGDKHMMGEDGRVLGAPGRMAAEKLQQRMGSIGIPSVINDMCTDGDALDLYNLYRSIEKKRKSFEKT